jgi:hypothetical protein
VLAVRHLIDRPRVEIATWYVASHWPSLFHRPRAHGRRERRRRQRTNVPRPANEPAVLDMALVRVGIWSASHAPWWIALSHLVPATSEARDMTRRAMLFKDVLLIQPASRCRFHSTKSSGQCPVRFTCPVNSTSGLGIVRDEIAARQHPQ